jgi:hypothetical protein
MLSQPDEKRYILRVFLHVHSRSFSLYARSNGQTLAASRAPQNSLVIVARRR